MKKTFSYGITVSMLLFVFVWPVFSAGFPVEETQPTPAATEGINYVMLIHGTEYNSKIGDMVDYFFKSVFKPGDTLMIFSPVKPYKYSPQTLQTLTKEQLIKQTTDVLKRDISVSSATYQSATDSMIKTVLDIGATQGSNEAGSAGGRSGEDVKSLLVQYKQIQQNFREQRNKLDEGLFMKLAEMYKNQKGKTVFYVFYQKEIKYVPDRTTMDRLRSNMAVGMDAIEIFQGENLKKIMDIEVVSQALKSSGVVLNFVYMLIDAPRRMGTEQKEFSTDVYNVFQGLAEKTGGTIISTSKVVEVFNPKKK